MIRRNIPNLFTAGNLVCGILAIIMTFSWKIELAPIFILVAAIFDFLDGFLARKLGVEGAMGKQMDSLADMVTFGVAPALIAFKLLVHSLAVDEIYLAYLVLLIPVFALFRLAKFNISEHQKNEFIGLPTPAMAIYFVALPWFYQSPSQVQTMVEISQIRDVILDPSWIITAAIVLSLLMMAPVRMFSLKFQSFGWAKNKMPYIFLTILVVLLATLFWFALPLIILLYIILSLINNLLSKDEIQS